MRTDVRGELDRHAAVLEAADEIDGRDRDRPDGEVRRDRDLDRRAAGEAQTLLGVVQRRQVELGLDLHAGQELGDEAVGVRRVDDQLALVSVTSAPTLASGDGDAGRRAERERAAEREAVFSSSRLPPTWPRMTIGVPSACSAFTPNAVTSDGVGARRLDVQPVRAGEARTRARLRTAPRGHGRRPHAG